MGRFIVSAFMVFVALLATHGLGRAAGQDATAILAGGCFWCVEHDFRQLDGVKDVVSGYSGGSRPNPTYQNYHDSDATYPVPHVEVVRITYDASTLSYGALLDFYARHVDPTDGGGQFCDRGPAYRPVIFVMDEQERAEAKTKLDEIAKLISQPVAVEIADAGPFWPAEDYHQDYAEKNPLRYKYYRWNCGRDQRIAEVWGVASR